MKWSKSLSLFWVRYTAWNAHVDCSLNVQALSINICEQEALHTTNWKNLADGAANPVIFVKHPTSSTVFIISVVREFSVLNEILGTFKFFNPDNNNPLSYSEKCNYNYKVDTSLFTYQDGDNYIDYVSTTAQGTRFLSNTVLDRNTGGDSNSAVVTIICKPNYSGDLSTIIKDMEEYANFDRPETQISVLDKNTYVGTTPAYKINYRFRNYADFFENYDMYVAITNGYAYFIKSESYNIDYRYKNEISNIINSLQLGSKNVH